MENNYNPYGAQGYQQQAAGGYAAYGQGYGANTYSYQNYTQPQYTPSSTTQTSSSYPATSWIGGSYAEQSKPEDAVAREMKQQNAQLLKQREDYVRKIVVLKRELELLKNQKQELLTDSSPPRDLESIVRENEKLQDEIQTKMRAINNVVEMLSGIIKDGKSLSDLEAPLKEPTPPPPVQLKEPSPNKPSLQNNDGQCNYVHYDPELHWCRMCDVFPQTAKEFLQHLQTKKHQDMTQENDVSDNTPWHKLPPEPELPHFEGAPKKRIPIKGLQFFISAPSWYCKLCDIWIGDLHCASHHLKSQAHFQNYANFVEQNTHWEMEWLKDREKALSRGGGPGRTEKSSGSEGESSKKKKRKDKRKSDNAGRDKKKKKRSKKRRKRSSDSSSSSSSSDSSTDDENDKSKSIRVAMRNIKAEAIMKEDLTEKWEMLGRIVEEHKRKEEREKITAAEEANKKDIISPKDDALISQWMTVSEPPEKEKYLLDSLKDKLKLKHSIEAQRYAEMERKQKDHEKREKEEFDRRQHEEREAYQRSEKERIEKERREYERITDKDRSQVKFKQNLGAKPYYRRRQSESPEKRHSSPEEPYRQEYKRHSPERPERNERSRKYSNGHRSRSRSRERKHERSDEKKKPPAPPSYKKLPFIGRMPLFKNRKPESDKIEKEIKKEDYDKPARQSRFQPGNLARSFIPEPAVVCFPKLSSYPELSIPPPAPKVTQPPPAPAAPKIKKPARVPTPPPPLPVMVAPPEPPRMDEKSKYEEFSSKNNDFDPSLYEEPSDLLSNASAHYYQQSYSLYYHQGFTTNTSHTANQHAQHSEPQSASHMMPLQPPPMPPAEDDLAMLGISADDMAAQSF